MKKLKKLPIFIVITLLYLSAMLLLATVSLSKSLTYLKESQEQTEEAIRLAEESNQYCEYLGGLAETYRELYIQAEGNSTEPSPPKISKTITVRATAYCPCTHCCGIWSEQHESRKGADYIQKTSSGTIPKEGRTIATDPKVIPYGTHVLINGHEYIAEDTGSAIKGAEVDMFFENHEDAVAWGVQNVEVSLIEN